MHLLTCLPVDSGHYWRIPYVSERKGYNNNAKNDKYSKNGDEAIKPNSFMPAVEIMEETYVLYLRYLKIKC